MTSLHTLKWLNDSLHSTEKIPSPDKPYSINKIDEYRECTRCKLKQSKELSIYSSNKAMINTGIPSYYWETINQGYSKEIFNLPEAKLLNDKRTNSR